MGERYWLRRASSAPNGDVFNPPYRRALFFLSTDSVEKPVDKQTHERASDVPIQGVWWDKKKPPCLKWAAGLNTHQSQGYPI
jgi:hypothetical protein